MDSRVLSCGDRRLITSTMRGLTLLCLVGFILTASQAGVTATPTRIPTSFWHSLSSNNTRSSTRNGTQAVHHNNTVEPTVEPTAKEDTPNVL
ncbi:DNA-directed RNA polymerase II subunit RPB1 [Sarotherodon galilaeus]